MANTDLALCAKDIYEKETSAAVRNFFKKMAMPLPKADEYLETRDSGFIVFLNWAASLIRFTKDDEYPSIRHDHILQPFGTVKTGCLRADFFPGVVCPVSTDDRDCLELILEVDKIDFHDSKEFNCGYIPKLSDHAKHCVVIDMGAVDERKSVTRETVTQEEYYHPLKEAFQTAWDPDAVAPDQSKLQELWATCEAMKEKGQLVSSWLDEYSALSASTDQGDSNAKKFIHMAKGSINYDRRWKALTLAK